MAELVTIWILTAESNLKIKQL